nr:MAG TPA: hypothetical protein [Caudoviricetes sp.]
MLNISDKSSYLLQKNVLFQIKKICACKLRKHRLDWRCLVVGVRQLRYQ